MKKILAFLLAAMLLLSIVGCAAQTQSDAQPAAAEPAADTSQPTQDTLHFDRYDHKNRFAD